MKITILALGSRGDVQPYAILGSGLRSAGHKVSFITSENFKPLVTSYDLNPCLIPGNAENLVQGSGARMSSLVRTFRDLSEELIHHSERIIPELANSDLILNQLPGGAYGHDIHEKYGVSTWLVATIPLVQTASFPMIGWPTGPSFIPGYNQTSYRIAEWAAWYLLRPLINRWRTEKLELPSITLGEYFDLNRKQQVPVLNGFSNLVVPRPKDWGSNIINTGYWFEKRSDWKPPEELVRFVEKSPRPLFIGFGSMPATNPRAVSRVIIDAVKKTGCRAVLHAGWARLGDIPLPEDVFLIDEVPYSWLFPRMKAVIHHGGSGTTSAGLSAGVPSIIVPFLFDQFFWGSKVNELGVGPKAISFRKLTSDRLANRIQETLYDTQMQIASKKLGEKLRIEDGVATTINIIETFFRSAG